MAISVLKLALFELIWAALYHNHVSQINPGGQRGSALPKHRLLLEPSTTVYILEQ